MCITFTKQHGYFSDAHSSKIVCKSMRRQYVERYIAIMKKLTLVPQLVIAVVKCMVKFNPNNNACRPGLIDGNLLLERASLFN